MKSMLYKAYCCAYIFEVLLPDYIIVKTS